MCIRRVAPSGLCLGVRFRRLLSRPRHVVLERTDVGMRIRHLRDGDGFDACETFGPCLRQLFGRGDGTPGFIFLSLGARERRLRGIPTNFTDPLQAKNAT